MSSRPIHVSLIGCGAVAETFYAPALQSLERSGRCEVVALVDPSPQRAAQLQRAFPRAKTFEGLDQLAGGDEALAIIASPVRFHAEQTLRALDAGLSVLCEKPMAASVAESQSMIEAAHARGKVLAIGLYRRFLPATSAIREWVSGGALGAVRRFSYVEGVNYFWPAKSASFFKREVGGGGVLIDTGAHALDLVLWWFGQPSEFSYEDDAVGGVEANCRLSLKYPGGAVGEVRLSRDWDWQLDNRCVIECERGSLSWTVWEPEKVQIRPGASRLQLDGRLIAEASRARPPLGFTQCFLLQLLNVFDAVQGSQAVRVTGETALAGMKLIEQCYRQRTLMQMPWMSPAEYQRAQMLAKAGGSR